MKTTNDDIFADVYAMTNKPSQAIIAAHPHLKDNPDYAKVKAQRELKKPHIQEKIDKKLKQMSKKALKQIDVMITSDNEAIATQNSWKVIEHTTGTPVRRTINVNATVSIEEALNQLN